MYTIILSRLRGDYRRGIHWWTHLLTTYTHHSELQIITALSLIFIHYKSSQHPLSLFPACCVFISRSLAMTSNNEDSWASSAQVLSSQPPVQDSALNWQLTGPESESELLYDWRFTANHFVFATSTLSLTASNFIFQLNICGYNPYVTFSLKRRWVYHLQLLLVLASAVILRSEWDSWPHLTVSESRLPQPGEAGPRIHIPHWKGGPVIPPGTGFPFRRLLRLTGLRWRCRPPVVFLITTSHGSSRKQRFQQ
jgi:hypothetical protein